MDEPRDSTAYADAKRAARTELRTRLLRVAGERLESEGVEGLSMRPLARAAGCSTMVFYTEFGSKEGLLAALADERVERLLEAVETVADIDPDAHRRAVARAFLAAVSAMPEGYRVVSRLAGGDEAAAQRRNERRATLDARLTAALDPEAGLRAGDWVAGVALALHGAAERIVAGAESLDDLVPVIDALLAGRPGDG